MTGAGRLAAVAAEAVDAGAGWLAQAGAASSAIRLKASGEEVTDADVEVERRMTRILRERTPEIPVMGEETAYGHTPPERCWLLDPIDGTMNFARHSPMYAISLALLEGGEPVIGVVHAPVLRRRWSVPAAVSDEAAGPPPAAAPAATELSRAVIGVSGSGSDRFSQAGAFIGFLHERAYRIRLQGAMSLDLVGVAEGWIDACVCAGPGPWDVAAGIALVRAAGRTVVGQGGAPFTWDSPVLAAGDTGLARRLAEVWDSV